MDKNKRSSDKAAQEVIDQMAKDNQVNSWDRLDAQEPQCGFGKLGVCCTICTMGPCRIDPYGNGPQVGNILLATTAGNKLHGLSDMPLDISVA